MNLLQLLSSCSTPNAPSLSSIVSQGCVSRALHCASWPGELHSVSHEEISTPRNASRRHVPRRPRQRPQEQPEMAQHTAVGLGSDTVVGARWSGTRVGRPWSTGAPRQTVRGGGANPSGPERGAGNPLGRSKKKREGEHRAEKQTSAPRGTR